MMNKNKTRFGAWKLLAVLPLAGVLLMAGCKPVGSADEETVCNTSVGDQLANDAISGDGEIVAEPESFPEFAGGDEALYKYLADNIHYPEKAKAERLEGRVVVQFVVEADGSITNAQVVRGIGGECDAEALRVVEAMPHWNPGMKNGQPVRTQYYLPITYKLQ